VTGLGPGARAALAVLLAAGLAGVPAAGLDAPPSGAPSPADPGSPFPTPERLEDLTGSPLPEGSFDRDVAVVERWTLEGPFPEVVAAAPYREPSDWGALLEAEVDRRAGLLVATESLHCAAREWGRFHLEHGAPPDPDLAGWMGARCSASVPSVSFHHFEGGIPENATEAEVFEGWRDAVASLLAERLVGGPLAAGIWYGRRGNRAIAVLASGERLLHLEPLPTVLPADGDGSFVLRGELLVPAEDVDAAVNRGRYGVSDCERDAGLRLPRFAFLCRTDPADAESWLSVSLTPPGRILGRGALGVVLWPSGQPRASWQRPALGDPVLLTPETDVDAELKALVNRLRKQADLAPLELSAAQSRVAARLAPYYFASVFGFAPGTSGDLVVLGLIAGWNVDGVVQSGGFAASWVVRSLDLDRLVANAIQYPAGRRALLDPDARWLAVGTVVRQDAPFLAGVFGTYALFDAAAHDDDARRVLEALDAARAARGKPPIEHLPKVASLGRLAAGRVQAGEAPPDVLNDLLRQSSQVLQRSVNGWLVETRELGEIVFPEALLESDRLELAIGVSHHKPKGEAWGRYVILLVSAGGGGGRGA
jgi:hypothetical protein